MTRAYTPAAQPTLAQRAGCLAAVVGLSVLAATVVLGLVVAGHLAYVFTGRPWPHLRSLGWAVWHTWAHPGTPLVDWPAARAGGGRPGTWWVWALTAAMFLLVFTALVLVVAGTVKFGRGRRSVGGMATGRQESRANTEQGLRAQAAQLRPTLSATTSARDIRVEQLGSYQGQSVSTGQRIYQPGQDSQIVCGLTGSGKTTTKVVPDVIDWDGPQVVSSTKVDILRSTWHAAAARGGVEVFDLLGLSGGMFPAARISPVAECEDADVAATRAVALFNGSTSKDGPNVEFTTQGKSILRGLLHAAGLADLPFSTVLHWANNPEEEEPLQIITGSSRGYGLYADQLEAARKQPEKQRLGAYLSIRAAVDPVSTPRVLGGIDHRPSECLRIRDWMAAGVGSLYLISHKQMLPGAERVVTFLIDAILEEARMLAAQSTNARLDPMLSIWADEATNACQLSDWTTVLSDSRGWGISAKMAIQSRALLRDAYGRDKGDAIWSAANTRLMIGGGEGGHDAKELAAAFGQEEVLTYSRSIGSGHGTIGSRERAVRTEADILNLQPGRGIMRASQMPPVELKMQPWWDRPDAKQITTAGQQYDQARSGGTPLPGVTRLGTRP